MCSSRGETRSVGRTKAGIGMTQPVKKARVEEELCYGHHSHEIDTAEADECNSTADEQEAALVALVDHRTREVHHLRQRVSYYTRQVIFSPPSSSFH